MTNEELVRDFPEWSVEKVAQKVGVESRHLAADNETAGDMAEKAALKLFEEHKVSPSSIDFLMLCTQSPDYFLPSTACVLQDKLGIPTSAGAFDYNLGCSGCVYGMAMAKGLIAAGIAKNVLLLTAETYNKYLHPKDKSNRSIFGDGAAACLISSDGLAEIGEFVLGTDGSGANHLILKSGASRQKVATGQYVEDEEGHLRQWPRREGADPANGKDPSIASRDPAKRRSRRARPGHLPRSLQHPSLPRHGNLNQTTSSFPCRRRLLSCLSSARRTCR